MATTVKSKLKNFQFIPIMCTEWEIYNFFIIERVEDGWYWPSGHLIPGEIPKECQCPGNPSGNKFANKCYFEKRIDGIACQCETGYVGYRCEQCAINYYGNPTERGGSCQMCQCNNNTDIYDPESCDRETGQCKKCRFNTDGDSCEKCLPGFYGNALNHDCKRKYKIPLKKNFATV